MIYTILYIANAKSAFDEHDLSHLVDKSRIWNESHGITGCLAYVEGVLDNVKQCQFIQVLEGLKSDVDEVFLKIKSDPRQENLSVIKEGLIDKRNFHNWRMGFEQLQLKENPLLQTFFSMDVEVLSADGDIDNNLLMKFMRSFCDQ